MLTYATRMNREFDELFGGFFFFDFFGRFLHSIHFMCDKQVVRVIS